MPIVYDNLNLTQTINALRFGSIYDSKWADELAMLNARGGLTTADYAREVERVTNGYVKPTLSKNGTILGYNVRGYVAESIPGITSNSNSMTLARGTVTAPIETNVIESGSTAVRSSRLSGLGSKVVTGAGKLLTGVAMVSAGCTLGKMIDETLYNANPDFWNSIGAETLNPQTWGSIAGENEAGQSFINALFGIDPDTGETQAYIDQNALAYMAYVMAQAGVFAQGEGYVIDESVQEDLSIPSFNFNKYTLYSNDGSFPYSSDFAYITDACALGSYGGVNYVQDAIYRFCSNETTDNLCMFLADDIRSNARNINVLYIASPIPIPTTRVCVQGTRVAGGGIYTNWTGSGGLRNQYTYDGKTVYYMGLTLGENNVITYPSHTGLNVNDYGLNKLCWAMVYGGKKAPGGIEGISDQEGATIPNFDGLSESDYLPYLQQTYPDMFNNAINYPVVQPDGTVKNNTYVPITLPNSYPQTSTQPVTDGQTQTQPSVDPSTAPQNLVDLLTQLLTQPDTGEIPSENTPPENPPDTGEGETPPIVAPTGNASALWAIYHPSQSEIDQFGAWLWSSNFIDQIQKIFNNPMESIIGLHKVYATPVDAGTSTIGVGYLDSGVSSAYITQQYVDVNCGSVNLYEQFGNVFDYSPFTSVKLYLPFIGIVNLDVAEVMRATISVSYGVDVLTGACLARVTISRDGNSNVLYQYAGNCAVQYPLSMGSYMGIVSSIIGVAGSIAATVASGGSVAPLAIGAASAAFNAHTSVQNSGNFSGNAGAMGGKKPYLIVERPQTKLANNQESFEGVPTNDYSKLGNMSGFVKCRDMHLINVNATDTEINEIRQYLYNGVIV